MNWTDGALVERLPNGLTLVAQRDPAAPAAAVVTHVSAGFFDEPDRWQGISHVLEHMFFKGTARRGVGRIAQETKALGGYLNASTSYDRTLYYAVLPVRNLAAAIDIQADALRNPLIDGDELARELKVIIEEAKRKLDSPSAVAGETLHELLYDQHRMRRWRIGHETQLATFTAAEVRGYYASRYVPSRVVVSLVGDMEAQALLDLARPQYEDWAVDAAPVGRGPEETSEATPRTRTLRGDVAHAELVLGWRGIPVLHADEAALDLAAAILGSGRGAWLHRTLREPGIAASTGAYQFSTDEVGVFGVAASGAADRVPEMVRGLAAEVTALRERGPTATELERARTLMKVRWVRRMESFEARATGLAWAVAHGDVTLLDREYTELLAATPAQVQDAARRYLRPEAVSGIAYLPNGAGIALEVADVEAAFAAPVRPARSDPRPPLPTSNGNGRASATARTIAGTLHLDLPGADLLIRRKPGIPTTTLAVHFRREWEAEDDAGLAALGARSAIRGAGAFDASALALAFEALGGSLHPSVSTDILSVGTTILTERMEDAARLIRLVLCEPRFEEADVQAERRVLLQEARESADDMFRFPFQLAFREAFGGCGYGLPAGGLESSLPTFDVEQVRARWTRINSGRATIIAVGDEEPERLGERLIGCFPDLVGTTRAAVSRDGIAAWRAVDAAPVIHSRTKQQTAFAMLFPGPPRRDPAHAASEVWAAVASGLGGRLFEALREKRSLAYTVVGTAWSRRWAGGLGAYIATSPSRESEARAAMLTELRTFATEPPSGEELDRARNYLAGQTEVSRMTAGALAGEIAEVWLAGRGLVEMEAPWEAYRDVTAEEVHEVAQKAFDPSRMAEGVVRGSV